MEFFAEISAVSKREMLVTTVGKKRALYSVQQYLLFSFLIRLNFLHTFSNVNNA
jgi:hypothetical protein